ncbi:MAG TPA: hypothetical protein P5205_08250 [Candidatus Paceibacterota bacterium]|nr:hypothetical protein [Verrucomicrobiota bacterium]HSA10350.1 hypothetical protein [Candidatus Paceibacterota bacterium]
MTTSSVIRHQGAFAACFAALLSLDVCTASDRDSKDLITQFKATGISAPYVREKTFTTEPKTLCDSVFSCLVRRGADILAFDKASGLLTWCDTAGSFIALPTDASSGDSQDVRTTPPARWGSYVYGSALVTVLDNHRCLLTLFALSRSADFGQEAYSNGAYERQLLRAIDTDIYRASIGQAAPRQSTLWQKSRPSNSATNYAAAFRGHFRNVPEVPPERIRQAVQGNPYSVPVERLWTNLLCVLSQYDVVIDINPERHQATFARRVSIPDPTQTNATQRADVLMAALVEPKSADSCDYYLALLDERTLAPVASGGNTPADRDGKVPLLKDMPGCIQAAAMVARQLEQQLDTQMFYGERWGNKLLRRSNPPSSPPAR